MKVYEVSRRLPEAPSGYFLQTDADMLVLHRLDGYVVAAFNTGRADLSGILRAAQDDEYQEAITEPQGVTPNGAGDEHGCLQVQFLGRFKIRCGGEALPLGRNTKALAILKTMLAEPNRSVSQDHLLEWQWPESSLKRARWALNTVIRAIRELLRSWPEPAGSRDCLLYEDGWYRLASVVRVWTDAEEFDARHDEGNRLKEAGRVSEAAKVYEKAVGLYRGDYLLDDLHENWTMVRRERLINAYLEMLAWLATYYKHTGRFRNCIQACYAMLTKDCCYEEGHRLLIEYYIRLGMYGRASDQYRLYKRLLSRSYGTEPSSAFQSFYQRMIEKGLSA